MSAITYRREDDLSVADYIAVLGATTMGPHRPLANTARIASMLEGADLIVVARDADTPVGLARCLSDGAWVSYCAELAVRESHQGQGIGRRLLEECAAILGPGIGLVLLSEPEAVGFYEHVRLTRAPAFYVPRTDTT